MTWRTNSLNAAGKSYRSVVSRGTGLRRLPGSTLFAARDLEGDNAYALDCVASSRSMALGVPVDSSASVAAGEWSGATPLIA